MTRKNKATLHILIQPFVISASIEFLPAWLYLPIGVLGAMTWIGACLILAEKDAA